MAEIVSDCAGMSVPKGACAGISLALAIDIKINIKIDIKINIKKLNSLKRRIIDA